MRFENKVGIVTGAGQGIGEAYAKGLAREGASVVVADLNIGQAERVAKEIEADDGTATAVQVDVADPTSAVGMATAAVDAFGGVDYLVNNAAIYHGMKLEPIISVDLDYYNRIISVNMNGVLHCSRACFPSMAERGGGAIVNQSSTAAWMAGGYYSVAKAGVNILTACLASELGSMNIRVNAIAPGPTDTEATRTVVPKEIIEPMVGQLALKRMGQPEDMVGACLFLLSDDAAWLTGQVIPVDGGQVVRI